MTEAEWLSCQNPQMMLEFLRDKVSDRKLRLFAVACCRNIDYAMFEQGSWLAIDTSEKFADRLVHDAELLQGRRAAEDAIEAAAEYTFIAPELAAHHTTDLQIAESVDLVANFAADAAHEYGYLCDQTKADGRKESASQCKLLRCIFGSRFHSSNVRPSWPATVTALADFIYTDRSFEQLPILADALEEGGSLDAKLLKHLRSEGPHVRGCWALDAVLGKS
jgi:hypothetical protein